MPCSDAAWFVSSDLLRWTGLHLQSDSSFFQRKEVESQRQRGEEMDAMLAERDKKLSEKEAYIVHLQTALAGDQPVTPAPLQKVKHPLLSL